MTVEPGETWDASINHSLVQATDSKIFGKIWKLRSKKIPSV